MIDRPYANPAAALHLPDVRLHNIVTALAGGPAPFVFHLNDPNRAWLIVAQEGDFWLQSADDPATLVALPEGSTVGFQQGLPHTLTGRSSASGQFRLFTSSIQRRAGVLQGMDAERVIVPPDAEPTASLIRHAVAIHALEYQARMITGDDMIIRRCAEILMALLVRHTRDTLVDSGDVPSAMAHDEHLLRAWAAYFAAPRARWTVRTLADAAGLSRSAFAARFRSAVGVPPLQALTDLRMIEAQALLSEGATPLIEIAFNVGYNSEAAFVRAFHRKFGMPPGRWRNEHKASGQ